ncbi:uncharacterized protein [Magallana gigas]|uniref:uncharacterized protein n=1 Tax=Magallana gigas TaxID=29159 RepID=UPI0033420D3B
MFLHLIPEELCLFKGYIYIFNFFGIVPNISFTYVLLVLVCYKDFVHSFESEMCMEQALTIHALLKEKMCPYKLLESKQRTIESSVWCKGKYTTNPEYVACVDYNMNFHINKTLTTKLNDVVCSVEDCILKVIEFDCMFTADEGNISQQAAKDESCIDSSSISSTASTRPATKTDNSTYPAEITTSAIAASQESLPTSKPCPLTSTVSSITAENPSTLKDSSTASTSTEEISVSYIAASGIGGMIIGAVLALLFVFLLQKLRIHLRSQLAEEHSLENPAYNKNHIISDQFNITNASQSEEYSEIQPNLYSRRSVSNNYGKVTQHMKSKCTNIDYDHLNDAFDTDTNDESMYDHAQFISKTQSDQQVDKDNGDYMQTSPVNVDRSYVEVTGEGSEGFVIDN